MNFLTNIFDFNNPGSKVKKFAKAAYIISLFLIVMITSLAEFLALVALFKSGIEVGEMIIYLVLFLILAPIVLVLVFLIALFALWLPCIVLYMLGDNNERLTYIESNTQKTAVNAEDTGNREKANNIENLNFKEYLKKPVGRFAEKIKKKTEQVKVKSEASEVPQTEAPKDLDAALIEKPEKCNMDPKLLAYKLTFALKFETLDGMLNYLKDTEDDRVQEIIKQPRTLIRNLVIEYADELNKRI